MDKRDFKDYIKMLLIAYGIFFLVYLLPILIVFSVMAGKVNGTFLENLKNSLIIFGVILLILSFSIVIITGLIYLFQKIKKKSDIIHTKGYIRDLPEYFSPAIVSLLLDCSIEPSTDYNACIAYLLSKKYIEIDDEKGKVKVIKDKSQIIQPVEEYALNCLLKNKQFDSEIFKKLVIDEAIKLGFIEKGRRKIHFFRNFLLSIFITFAISYILPMITNPTLHQVVAIIGLISGISIYAVIGYSIYLFLKYSTESYHRTKLGNQEATKWSKIRNYIRDFTLLSDKNLEDTAIFDDYIAYAISLGEAKQVEKYIETNDKYRILIYGSVNTFYKNL